MSFKVKLDQARDPLLLALDVGSTGTRAGLFDATGLPVSGVRAKIEHVFTTGADGTSTVDADQVADEMAQVISTTLQLAADTGQDLRGRIAGVAMDTFSSSLVGVSGGRAVTPCYTYADSRGAENVATLRERFDEAEVQQRTGTRQHTSYLPARLMWLAEQDLDVEQWMSLSEYIHLRLLGTTACGTSIAAWTGMLDRHTGTWDEPLMAAAGVRVDQFSPIHDHDQPLRAQAGSPAAGWPEVADADWYPALSDGFASNFGTGASDPATAVISLATSGAIRVLVEEVPDRLPSGLWCYRIDQRRSLLGGALNDVGRAYTWMDQTLRLPEEFEPRDEALRAEPRESTPLVLPFLTGERSTGWNGSARAVLSGVSAGHEPLDFYRAMSEGIALSFARVAGQLRDVAGTPARILAAGGVCGFAPGLLQIIADTLQLPVAPVTIKRATLHGTALAGLEVAAPGVARAVVETGEVCAPHPERAAYYAGRLQAFERAYAALVQASADESA